MIVYDATAPSGEIHVLGPGDASVLEPLPVGSSTPRQVAEYSGDASLVTAAAADASASTGARRRFA